MDFVWSSQKSVRTASFKCQGGGERERERVVDGSVQFMDIIPGPQLALAQH